MSSIHCEYTDRYGYIDGMSLVPASWPTRTSWTSGALAAGLVVCWSSGFVGARFGTEHASAATLLAWRLLVAGTLAIGWLAWRRSRLSGPAVRAHLGIGLLTQVGYLGGVVGGVGAGVPAGTTALIAALQPILVAAVAAPLLHEPVRARAWWGLGLGLAGVALVVADDMGAGNAPVWAYALPVAGMLALSAGTMADRRAPAPAAVLDAVAVHTVVAAVCFVGYAGATDALAPPAETDFVWAVAWVVVLSTIGGYGSYLAVLRRLGATRTSALLYLTPPTTMLWAYAMFGESIGSTAWIGLVLCAFAVAGVLRTRPGPGRSERLESQPSAGSKSTSRSGVKVSASG
jgi:drug/metabolite transporter (DMT)-like permease